jgi:undecaprenyl-diphosphatase
VTDHPLIAARKSRVVVPWWWLAVLLAAVAIIRWYAEGPGTVGLDRDVTRWVQEWDQPLASQLADAGNFLGNSTPALIVMAALWVLLPLLRLRRELIFLSVEVCLRFLATFLKEWNDSPRPAAADDVEILGTFDGFGFPSGHAITAALVLGTIWFLVCRFTTRRDYQAIAVATWIAGMLLTDFARVWVGAHWFTDVVGGSLIGVLIVLTATNISALLSPDRAIETQTRPHQTLGQ